MPEKIRFYMDQHIAFAVAEGLRRRGVDILTSQEAGRCSFSDPDQLSFATEQQRVMVSFDADYLSLAASGLQHEGIAWCPSNKHTVGELVSALLLIYGILDREDMRNHVEFL